jgi:hypothetical protein
MGKRMRAVKKQTYMISKGLTRKEAWTRALRTAKRDFRGMSYDRKTGKLVLI